MARREFGEKTKRDAFLRSGGKCERCGAKIIAGNGPEYHHIVDAWVGGSNDLDNCQVLCRKPCHSTITHTQTRPQIQKTKDVLAKRAGIKTPKGRALPGTKRSGLRKRMSGQVERWP